MKKNLGRTSQNKPPFPRFFKKIGNPKNTFFPSWQKFPTSIFEKRPKIVAFWGPRPQKLFFNKISIKKNFDTPKISIGTLPINMLRPFFEKAIFRFSYFCIFFFGKLQPNFVHFPQKIYFSEVFWGNH